MSAWSIRKAAHDIKVTSAEFTLDGEPTFGSCNVICSTCSLSLGPFDDERLTEWLRDHISEAEEAYGIPTLYPGEGEFRLRFERQP